MSAKTYRTLAEIEADVPQSDVYICGSDQIWNCKNKLNGKDDAFFLSFAPAKARKVAYAASIAMPEIPNNQKARYRRLISDFDAVSVREPSSVPMLEDLGIDNVQSVIDRCSCLNETIGMSLPMPVISSPLKTMCWYTAITARRTYMPMRGDLPRN